MENDKNLLPCPFCGSTHVKISKVAQDFLAVECTNEDCYTTGPMCVDETDISCVIKWNTRTPTDNDARIAVYKDALKHSHNALLDYVERLENQGCGMGYGRSVIAMIDAALSTNKGEG